MSTFKVTLTIFWAVVAVDVFVGNYRVANAAAQAIGSIARFTSTGTAEDALTDRCEGSAALLLCRMSRQAPSLRR